MQNNFTSLNGSIHSLFNQRFSFKHLAALVASVLVILCAVWLPYALFWQLDGLLSLQQAQILGSCMFYGGIASFVAIAVVTRFRLSKDWSLKRNVGLFSVLLSTTLVFSSLLSAPVVAALTPLPSDSGPNGSSAYKFSIPFTPYEWFIGEFRDGSYYAVNGSDWNIMTIAEPWQPVAPWASLSTDLTALTEQCLSVTSSGVIFLKQVPFDLALMNSIPANVKVACSYQDQYCEYINSADSSGSPYTVEVGAGLNDGYYIAKDSENRICFASTDCPTVINNATLAAYTVGGGTVHVNALKAVVSTVPIIARSNVTLTGEGSATVFTLADHANIPVIYSPITLEYATISNFRIEGNRYNQDLIGNHGVDGVTIHSMCNSTIDHVYVYRAAGNGFNISYSFPTFGVARDNKIANNQAVNCGYNGFFIHLVDFTQITENSAIDNDQYGYNLFGENWVTKNRSSNNTLGGFYIANGNIMSVTDNVCNYDCGSGIYVAKESSVVTISNNQIIGAGYIDHTQDAILCAGSNCIISNNLVNASYRSSFEPTNKNGITVGGKNNLVTGNMINSYLVLPIQNTTAVTIKNNIINGIFCTTGITPD